MTGVSDFESWDKGQKIGQGAFGQVFMVTTSNGDQLAAKYIKLASNFTEAFFGSWFHFAGDHYTGFRDVHYTGFPAEVQREIEVLKQLRHKNVVKFVAVKRVGGDMVVFTEFINGKELAALGRLNEVCTTVFLCQICFGLNYLHTRNPPVLHRDIKGQNIMVARDCTVKLIDFGLSINIMVSSGINVTQAIMTTGNACGTLPFMAPELFAERCQFSVKSDVWALGMTIYQMMTGEPPFADADSVQDLVRRIKTLGAPPLPDGSSQQLANFYACCTDMDPATRQSVRQLLEHELFSSRSSIFAPPRPAENSCCVLQ